MTAILNRPANCNRIACRRSEPRMTMQAADYAWAIFAIFITLVLLAGWRVKNADAGLFAAETAAASVCESSLVACQDPAPTGSPDRRRPR